MPHWNLGSAGHRTKDPVFKVALHFRALDVAHVSLHKHSKLSAWSLGSQASLKPLSHGTPSPTPRPLPVFPGPPGSAGPPGSLGPPLLPGRAAPSGSAGPWSGDGPQDVASHPDGAGAGGQPKHHIPGRPLLFAIVVLLLLPPGLSWCSRLGGHVSQWFLRCRSQLMVQPGLGL